MRHVPLFAGLLLVTLWACTKSDTVVGAPSGGGRLSVGIAPSPAGPQAPSSPTAVAGINSSAGGPLPMQALAPPIGEKGNAILVATLAQASAATDKRVRVTGTAQREKRGDSLSLPELVVICLRPRFPDALIGKQVTVEGQLALTSQGQATRNARGEISQGTEPGNEDYVIHTCTLLR